MSTSCCYRCVLFGVVLVAAATTGEVLAARNPFLVGLLVFFLRKHEQEFEFEAGDTEADQPHDFQEDLL